MALFTSNGRPPDLNKHTVGAIACQYFSFSTVNEDSIKALPSYEGRNYYFEGSSSAGTNGKYILKLYNIHSPLSVVEGGVTMISMLQAKGVLFQVPEESRNDSFVAELQLSAWNNGKDIRKTNVEIIDTTKRHSGKQQDNNIAVGSSFIASIVTYVPGEEFDSLNKKYLIPEMLQEIGIKMAVMDKELRNFTNAALEARKNTFWDLFYFLELRKKIPFIEDTTKAKKAMLVLNAFEKHVAPKISNFKKSIIHGDVSGLNLIMEKNLSTDRYHFKSFIDFEDASETCTVFELAIGLAYIMLENLTPSTCSNCVELVRPVIDGYTSVLPLSRDELDSLYYLIMARACQSAVNGELQFKQEPWNIYLLTTPEKFWILIEKLLEIEKAYVDHVWFQ